LISRLLVAAFASAAVAASSSAASPPPGGTATARPIDIDRNSVLILIRTTLVALQQANQTGNYSVLYGISAPGFQQLNSPEKLAQIFANLRAKGFDLSAVTVLDPQLSLLPVLYPNGVMRMSGFFPSVPLQVDFDLQFIGVQGQWRLLGISVNIVPATSMAPSVEAPRPSRTTSAAPSSESPSPAPMESSTPAAPSVDIGKPKPKPTESRSKSTLAAPRP
jgi:hypothetical protein